MFKYVFIPASQSEPITTHTASKQGGLSNDALAQSAKQYFFEKGGGAMRAQFLDQASPDQKAQLVQQIRQEYSSSYSHQFKDMDDDALLNLYKSTHASATCEIICLTVPTPLNGYKAVSMYGDDNARNKNYPLNQRATDLMKACGHALPSDGSNEDGKPSGIYGDVFVGRCHDNEVEDIWERVDITSEEVEGDLEQVEWCRIAKKKGGGGGHGGSSAASLSSTLQNMSKGGGGNPMNHHNRAMTGLYQEGEENGYKWSQTQEEVELRFVVAPGTKAKYVKVKFGRKTLKVTVAGQTLCDGETWGNVQVDESTYTLQDTTTDQKVQQGRELCITLSKKDVGEMWNFAVMMNHR
jgi:hypothetical protein